MGRTKTSRYRNWRKQMRKRGQRPPRRAYNSYTWDYMSPGRLVAYADPQVDPKGGNHFGQTCYRN